MNRFLVSLTAFALAGSASLQAAGTDPNLDYNVLQGRIASLESKVKMLETALNELSAQVAEPSPTRTSAPITQAPAPPAKTETEKTPDALPSPAPEKPKAPAPAATEPEVQKYTIGEGDTISDIARKLDVPRSELMEANNLREGQQIYIGDQLIIPQAPAPEPKETAVADAAPTKKPEAKKESPAPTPAETGTNGTNGTYVVKSGDTLSKIAREHGLTIAALKTANGLSSDLINLGQKLKIPGKSGNPASQTDENTVASTEEINKLLRPEENYGVYTVERGDTLYSLARDFFTTPNEIQRLNSLGKSTDIRPGQDLVVPTSKYEQHHKLAKNG